MHENCAIFLATYLLLRFWIARAFDKKCAQLYKYGDFNTFPFDSIKNRPVIKFVRTSAIHQGSCLKIYSQKKDRSTIDEERLLFSLGVKPFQQAVEP